MSRTSPVRRCIAPTIACLLALALFSGCSGIEVKAVPSPGTDFTKYKTFAFFDSAKAGTGSMDPKNRPALEAELKEHLSAKALVFGQDSPDLIVRYTALAEDFTAESRMGYADGGYDYSTGFGAGVTMAKPYKKGTLVIDLVDTRTNKIVWRGTAKGEVPMGQAGRDAMHEALEQMFQGFPGGR